MWEQWQDCPRLHPVQAAWGSLPERLASGGWGCAVPPWLWLLPAGAWVPHGCPASARSPAANSRALLTPWPAAEGTAGDLPSDRPEGLGLVLSAFGCWEGTFGGWWRVRGGRPWRVGAARPAPGTCEGHGGSARSLLEKELGSVGIRLNKHKPNIYFKVRPRQGGGTSRGPQGERCGLRLPLCQHHRPALLQPKKGGGISFNSTVTLTQCSEKLVQLILHEYSILPERCEGGRGPSGSGGPGDADCPHHPAPQLRPSRRKAAATSHEALLSSLPHAPQASGWTGRSRAPLAPCRVQGRSRVEGRRDGKGQGLLGCGGLGATPGGRGGPGWGQWLERRQGGRRGQLTS